MPTKLEEGEKIDPNLKLKFNITMNSNHNDFSTTIIITHFTITLSAAASAITFGISKLLKNHNYRIKVLLLSYENDFRAKTEMK